MACTPNSSVTMKQDPCDFGTVNLVQMYNKDRTKILIGFKVEIGIKWWCDGYCPEEGVDSCPKGFNGFDYKKWFTTAIDDLDITNKEYNILLDLGERAWKTRKAGMKSDWTDAEFKWYIDFIKAKCSSIKLVMDKQILDWEIFLTEMLVLKNWCKCDEDETRRQKLTFMLNYYLDGRDSKSKRSFSI